LAKAIPQRVQYAVATEHAAITLISKDLAERIEGRSKSASSPNTVSEPQFSAAGKISV
jgi:hypothetical protein